MHNALVQPEFLVKWFQTTSLNRDKTNEKSNYSRLKPFDVKSILTYNIDGMVFCFIEDYVFVGNMIIIITMILL